MNIKMLILSLLVISFAACNSNTESAVNGDNMEQTMECCADAAAKGEKCAKCNHGDATEVDTSSAAADGDITSAKACCKDLTAKG